MLAQMRARSCMRSAAAAAIIVAALMPPPMQRGKNAVNMYKQKNNNTQTNANITQRTTNVRNANNQLQENPHNSVRRHRQSVVFRK